MNAVLGQLSIAIGGLLFVIVLVVAVARGVPILTAVFRASVVMCLASMVVAVFFRFLSSILRGFVTEQIHEHNKMKATKGSAGKTSSQKKPAMDESS